jgi:hypothetical protein
MVCCAIRTDTRPRSEVRVAGERLCSGQGASWPGRCFCRRPIGVIHKKPRGRTHKAFGAQKEGGALQQKSYWRAVRIAQYPYHNPEGLSAGCRSSSQRQWCFSARGCGKCVGYFDWVHGLVRDTGDPMAVPDLS